MDIQKRFFRRPVSTVVWLILLAAMALLIGVGGALWYSSGNLPNVLDEYHTTVALRADRAYTISGAEGFGGVFDYEDYHLMQEDLEYLQSLDSVEMVDLRTLTGAYSPELTSVLGFRSVPNQGRHDAVNGCNNGYERVVLAGTVLNTWSYHDPATQVYDLTAVGGSAGTNIRTICALLEIEEVISAHPELQFTASEEHPDFTGKVIIRAYVYDDGKESFFQEDARYIVSGNYYSVLSGSLEDPVELGFHPNISIATYASYGLCEKDRIICYETVYGNGLSDSGEETITVLEDPHTVIAKLDGSTQDFLAENQEWAHRVEEYDMSSHCLPVLGTECLETMYVFLESQATITQGRTFTQEEYDSGAKVCILSELVAANAGIQAGDQIPISQFLSNSTIDTMSTDGMLNNPGLGSNPAPSEFVTENETFTVVGIYRLETSWTDSSYSITPNTIFIPQKAQISGGFGGVSQEIPGTTFEIDGIKFTNPPSIDERGVFGVFLSVKLKNGMMENFLRDISQSNLADQFLTFDQGYEAAQASVKDVVQSAEKMFLIAILGWLLLLALYLLLYQGTQRKNLGIMRSLGAQPRQARRYLFGSGMLLATLGLVIGTAVSGYVMSLVQDQLLGMTLSQVKFTEHSGGMDLTQETFGQMLSESQLPMEHLLLLALAQLAIIAALLWLQAAVLSRKNPRKLMGV